MTMVMTSMEKIQMIFRQLLLHMPDVSSPPERSPPSTWGTLWRLVFLISNLLIASMLANLEYMGNILKVGFSMPMDYCCNNNSIVSTDSNALQGVEKTSVKTFFSGGEEISVGVHPDFQFWATLPPGKIEPFVSILFLFHCSTDQFIQTLETIPLSVHRVRPSVPLSMTKICHLTH